MARFNRLLITGAAGSLGTVLRKELKPLTKIMRVSDIRDLGAAGANEETVQCDLADRQAVMELTKDVDVAVHMGGVPLEDTFDNILHSNIAGFYNLFEGARKNGIRRIIWGSSNHAIGFYQRTQTIDASATLKPDSLYGVSKAFGEALAQYYYDKFGLETVSIRIGSCFPEPIDRRMLATWLSFSDMAQIVTRGLTVPKTGHLIIYGQSDNDEKFWDNTMASSLGYQPQDTADKFREKIEAATPVPDPLDPVTIYHGGSFTKAGHFED